MKQKRSLVWHTAATLATGLLLHANEPTSDNTVKEFSTMEMNTTNDGVMGGLSQGTVQRTEGGTYLFQGKLSLENNGGFSSWTMMEGKQDLSAAKGITLRVKGDGRDYKLRLSTNERYRFSRVAFQATFSTKANSWTTVTVPFSDLKASWRGRSLDRTFDPSKVRQLGVILADKKQGPFQLEVEKVWAVKQLPTEQPEKKGD